MRTPLQVVAGLQEAGSANALLPVLRELQAREEFELRTIARGAALQILDSYGIGVIDIDMPGEGDAVAHLSRLVAGPPSVDIVLTGSCWGPGLDKDLIQLSIEHGIPSVVLLDMWSHYAERFSDPATGVTNLVPTRVLVMDEEARRAVTNIGIAEGRVVVTGHPGLEELLVGEGRSETERLAAALRARWSDGEPVVLFASEIFSRDFPAGSPWYCGYTEEDALDDLAAVVRQLERDIDCRISLVVKLHPEEYGENYAMGPLAAEVVRETSDDPARVAIAAADVVVGMSSMMLIEAAVWGQPAFSYRPKAAGRSEFAGERLGVVGTLIGPDELRRGLTRVLAGEGSVWGKRDPKRVQQKHIGATRRVLEALQSLSEGLYDKRGSA